MNTILGIIKKILPNKLAEKIRPTYHFVLAFIAALIYRFPSRHITVIAVTGTKGKTSTTELISTIFEAGGHTTALVGTLHFKLGNEYRKNLYKMTMPGRFFVQRFLREAINKKCDVAIIEMSSEGARQNRHKFIELDALVFTNIAKEHIESHGSFNNYVAAKLLLAQALEQSPKKRKFMIANADDAQAHRFLSIKNVEKIPFHLTDAGAFLLHNDGLDIVYEGTPLHSHLQGTFNIYNILAAIHTAQTFNIPLSAVKDALEKVSFIRGRMEKVRLPVQNPLSDKQDFTVIVDYAHTPDSLEQAYGVYKNEYKICILGNTGGGRDKWKRKEMGAIADVNCDKIILANEDPYDEDPMTIINQVAEGITHKEKLHIILDRREAINTALTMAKSGDVIMITGKGTDPYIMEAHDKKTPWDDATVVREELEKVLAKK
ncbi:MAG: UDP-N-acetylmuramyl-tripeptide synthetase [Candidatus Paceibacterota bacterium]|jgi:UDP-N-acetylmuramoyl-L-alanyl-D-glutamate--2,6-diaminopimelate ligase